MFVVKLVFKSLEYSGWLWVMECITLTCIIWYTPSLILDTRMHIEEEVEI